MDLIYSIWLVAASLCVYLIPTFVAYQRDVRNKASVAVINVFLGWSLIGWVVALAMAARTVEQPEPQG